MDSVSPRQDASWFSSFQQRLPGTLGDRIGRKLGPGTSVLDVGCGTGLITQSLRSTYLRSNSVVGLDAYLPALYVAKNRGVYQDVICADVTRLPFKSGAFDIVLCIEVIEHLRKEDGFALVRELERLASNQVVLTTPNGSVPYHPLGHDDVQNRNPYSAHLSGWTPEDFRKMGYHVTGNSLAVVWGEEGLIYRVPAFLRPFLTAISYVLNPLVSRVPDLAARILCWKDTH